MITVSQKIFDPGTNITSFLEKNYESGATVTFIGQVRDFLSNEAGGNTLVTALEIEHYPGMTQNELERIAKEAAQNWTIDDILIYHRYGLLTPSDPIVLVGVAAKHRSPAFSACQFIIDWLKIKAPFWKREHTENKKIWVEAKGHDQLKAQTWKNN